MTETPSIEQQGSIETVLSELLRLLNESKTKEREAESTHNHIEMLKDLPKEIRAAVDRRITQWNEDGVPEEKIKVRLRQEIEQTLSAFEDKRFGIPNGSYLRMETFRLFDELVSERTDLAKIKGVAGMFFDMNGLKAVNDLVGHPVGDEYLRRVVQVFTNGKTTAGLREQGINVFVAMNGGDEVVVVLSDDIDMGGPDGSSKALASYQTEVNNTDMSDLINFGKFEVREKFGGMAIPDDFQFTASVSAGAVTLQEILSNYKMNPDIDYKGNIYNLEHQFFTLSGERSQQNKDEFKYGLDNGNQKERFLGALLKRTKESRELMERNYALDQQLAAARKRIRDLEESMEKRGLNPFESPDDVY